MFSSRQQLAPIRASNSWWSPGIHASPFTLPAILATTAFLSVVSLNWLLLFSRTISSLHTYRVDQLCLEVHHPINPFWQTVVFWDIRGMLADKALVEYNLSSEHEKVSYFAAPAPHSGHCFWLCLSFHVRRWGCKFVGLQSLWCYTTLCVPQPLPYGSSCWCPWSSDFVYKWASGKITRHLCINLRSFVAADLTLTLTLAWY